jgi:hypothetical protein
VNTANSNPCDDGNACTTSDTCQAGSCAGTDTCGSADLLLRLHRSNRGRVGREIAYRLKVKNRGPDPAVSATAEFTCSGVPFHLVGTPPSGCVQTAGSLTCALGTLSDGGLIETHIAIVPDAAGMLTCTANASSATSDPVPTNQSKTVETRIR